MNLRSENELRGENELRIIQSHMEEAKETKDRVERDDQIQSKEERDEFDVESVSKVMMESKIKNTRF